MLQLKTDDFDAKKQTIEVILLPKAQNVKS